eukprot:TRINITY_DN1883_c0_g1_i4.p1 TRINITY_DN1883_c0_g1~~TRINITY_DN1883_c0_g1_i4.p1  ORF type:complete len:569 (-),score=78.48 TRINITY_DN1883_c0_g1_i4:68-1696(-)
MQQVVLKLILQHKPKFSYNNNQFFRLFTAQTNTVLQQEDILGISETSNKNENQKLQQQIVEGQQSLPTTNMTIQDSHEAVKAILAQSQLTRVKTVKLLKDVIAKQGMDLDIQGITTAFNRIMYLVDANISQKRFLLDQVMELAASRNLNQLDSLAIGQILWAYGKCRHSPQQEHLNTLVKLVLTRKDEFDGQTFSNIFQGFAFMPRGSMALFSELAPTVADRMHEFEPRYIANLVWACATVGFDDQHFLFSVSQATTDKLNSFSPHDLSNVIWAFAKLNFVDHTLLDKIANVALSKADQFEPLAISSTLLSFAHLKRRDDVFFDMMAEVAKSRVKQFGPQSISNVVFAYAKLGYKNVELMEVFSNRTIEIIDEVEPKVLSTLAWAHGELNIKNQKLFDAINQEARKRLHEFDSQALSQLMWGIAKSGCIDEQLFKNVHTMVMPKIGTYKPNELSNLMWAFSKGGIYDSKLFTLGLEACLQQKFGAKSIANLMDAIATSRHYDHSTCVRFARSVEKKIDKFSADTIASILASGSRHSFLRCFG